MHDRIWLDQWIMEMENQMEKEMAESQNQIEELNREYLHNQMEKLNQWWLMGTFWKNRRFLLRES